MTSKSIRRAYEVTLLAARAGEPSAFLSALNKLETLDRTGEVSPTELLTLKAFGHTRCGDLKKAADAILRLGGAGSSQAQRIRHMLLDTPESSIARYRECIDSLIPAPSNPIATIRCRGPALVLSMIACAVMVASGIMTWRYWPREKDTTAPFFKPPVSTAWRPSLPPEVANSSSAAAVEYRRLTQLIGKVVCRAHVEFDDGKIVKWPYSTGSAFAVTRDGLLVTNKHVIEDVDEREKLLTMFRGVFGSQVKDIAGWDALVIFVTDPPLVLEGRIGRMSPYVDLATIQVNHKFDSVLEFGDTPVPGESVRAYGFPGLAEDITATLNERDAKERLQKVIKSVEAGTEPDLFDWVGSKNLQLVVTSGIVSAVRDTEQGRMIQTDAFIIEGNSGGPLLSIDGKVLGISTIRATAVESANFCIAARAIFEELARETGIKWPKGFVQ